tara:strand:- start:386 stop:643 length:258 start_codon:yes stop_codon:yes gene_type:complete
MKLNIIQAGYKAVDELIKVAEEKIILNDPNEDLAADRLKNAAATKKLAIFDAFEILTRLESEKNVIDVSDKVKKPFKGFAERRSK